MTAPLSALGSTSLTELVPVVRRAAALDPRAVVRVRAGQGRAAVWVRLPFGILVGRAVGTEAHDAALDVTVGAVESLAWVDGDRADPPTPRDADWRWALPPASGWTRLDSVPDDVVRSLVRQGATALEDAAAREGVPGAQPRAEVADALLDAVVLTVQAGDGRPGRAEVTLRAVSALTRMGFLPRGGRVHVDTAGRWVRLLAEYGTVYLERPGSGLTLA